MLKIEHLRKTYGPVVAVDEVTLEIGAGELCTLLGPSGCGKTTLLRMIAGLERQTSGRILIQGRDVSNDPPFRRAVGMVFQSYALFPHLTVRQNIAYGLEVLKRARPEIRRAVGDIATLLEIGELLGRHVNQLSGGQQQRVALARALVMKPQILLFDEPLSNLDAKLRRGIREEIRTIQQQLGITAIYVTHDQSEALAISDRVVVMHLGRIVQQGPPRELYDSPVDAFVANFIGEANLVPVEVAPCGPRQIQIRLGDYAWEQPGTIAGPGRAQLLLRPERIPLSTNGQGIRATVRKATYVGHAMEYTLQCPWGDLFVIYTHRRSTPWQVGQTVFYDPAAMQPLLIGLSSAPAHTPNSEAA